MKSKKTWNEIIKTKTSFHNQTLSCNGKAGKVSLQINAAKENQIKQQWLKTKGFSFQAFIASRITPPFTKSAHENWKSVSRGWKNKNFCPVTRERILLRKLYISQKVKSFFGVTIEKNLCLKPFKHDYWLFTDDLILWSNYDLAHDKSFKPLF